MSQSTIVDPGPESLALLAGLGLHVGVHTDLLPSTAPLLARTRVRDIPLQRRRLGTLSTVELRRIHDQCKAGPAGPNGGAAGMATLWELKLELARRALLDCRLCGWDCGVDRAAGQRGPCGLGAGASPALPSVHVAEEALINPSLLVPVRGCALRCRSCQQWRLLAPGTPGPIDPLGRSLPPEHRSLARTLSFIGGNPDENLPAIFAALDQAAPSSLLPIVWNTHAWVPTATIDLLDGVVDVWVPDLKYADDACASALSGVEDYVDRAQESIARMVASGAPVIVRLLLLPGHFECCIAPSLRFLAASASPGLSVSLVRYTPEWRTVGASSPIGAATSRAVLDRAARLAGDLALTVARPGLTTQISSGRVDPVVRALGERDNPASMEIQ